MKRSFFSLIVFLFAFFAVERFCHKQTHGFRLGKIRSEWPYNPDWEISAPNSAKIASILSQRFHFLDSGGEAYVFASEDGHYVLKFFKHHHMRPKNIEDLFLPSSFRKKYRRKRLEKLDRLFTSCLLAYENFREETGLVYLHLNPTQDLNIKCTIYDPIACIHKINLDDYTFALQKRATMAYPTLTALIEAQEVDAAKHRLESLIDLMNTRCKVGLADHDACKRNFGFLGEKAIELDVGSFTYNERLKNPEERKKTLLHETIKLRKWIKKNHPELSEFFDETLQKHLI